MEVRDGLFYTKDHEWIKIEADTATVGISDYAQSSLGDITFVELPRQGQEIKQFQPCATVESVKAASEVYAPLSGSVISLNSRLFEQPELVNKSPYEEGYFFKMRIADSQEVAKLMGAMEYRNYLKGLEK